MQTPWRLTVNQIDSTLPELLRCYSLPGSFIKLIIKQHSIFIVLQKGIEAGVEYHSQYVRQLMCFKLFDFCAVLFYKSLTCSIFI